MPVDTPRKEYTAALPRWTRCRDVAEGADAVKAKREEYLPKVSAQQKAPAYSAYLKRAHFYGATARTIQGCTGAILGKPPLLQGPDGLLHDRMDITQSGVSLDGFARSIINELLTVGRHGVLVDMAPDAGTTGRPYWVPYLAQNIVSWRTAVVQGDTVLTRVVLKECVEEQDPKDEFETQEVEQYRVLSLDADGFYQVVTYRKADNSGAWIPKQSEYPVRRGARLDFIPFQFFGPSQLTTAIEKPPFLDLVDTNLAHYQVMADRRQNLHYMGQVQAYVCGVDDKSAPTSWGSGNVWRFDDANAKAGLLQAGSDGAAPLREFAQDLEQQMAILGARFLEGQVRKQEAAETVRLRRSSDVVVLSTVGQTASLGISNLLRWHAWWAADVQAVKTEDVTYQLNTDFAAARLRAEELKALVLAVQAGRISGETFYHALQRGDWTEPGVDYKTEQERIAAEMPDLEDPDDGDEGGREP